MGIGWKNAKKVVGRTPGFYSYTKQDMNHVGWCIEKNIKVLTRTVVDSSHKGAWYINMWPNWLGEVAIYHLTRS